jgi:hypothetical protein
MNNKRGMLVLAVTTFFALSVSPIFAQDGGGGTQASAGAKAVSVSSSTSSTSNRNNSSGNNTIYSSNSTYKEQRQTPPAYAPDALPTAPCFKSFSGGGSSPFFGVAFGAGKIDKGCDDRETARIFAQGLRNFSAAAKILCSTDAAKRAHLTMEDCMDYEEAQAPPPPPAPAPPVVVNVAPSPATLPAVVAAPAPSSMEEKKISE